MYMYLCPGRQVIVLLVCLKKLFTLKLQSDNKIHMNDGTTILQWFPTFLRL